MMDERRCRKDSVEFGFFMNSPKKDSILFDGAVPEVTTSDLRSPCTGVGERRKSLVVSAR